MVSVHEFWFVCRFSLVFPIPLTTPIIDDGRATNPTSTAEAVQQLVANFENLSSSNSGEGRSGLSEFTDSEDSKTVAEAKKIVPESTEYSYTERDIILYNIGIGASEKEVS